MTQVMHGFDSRDQQLEALKTQEYDVAVLGGGINGAGIALDLALRGISTVLLEKKDFGWYATSSSTKLIHGGLRYLEYFELALVRESMAERERLLKNAPHLVKPLKLNVPVYEHSKRPAWMIRLGLTLYDLLSYDKSLPNHKYSANTSRQRQRGVIDPALNQEGLSAVCSYYDCQVAFPERLALELILGAEAAGARVLNYVEVTGLTPDATPDYHILQAVDVLHGSTHEIRTRYVINAGGPFVDQVNLHLEQSIGRKMGGTKGSHLIIRRFDGGPQEAVYVEARQDGRPYFVIPWLDYYLVGTTDIFYDGDMDEVHATQEEVAYLLTELNALIPGHRFTVKDVLYTYSGIRPLPYEPGKKERSVTRKHIILEHARAGGSPRVFSIIGGKLTTYRSLAEETAALISKRLNRKTRCQTRNHALPGAAINATTRQGISALVSRHHVSQATAEHMLAYYGSRAKDVLEQLENKPELGALVQQQRPEIMAEVAFAVQVEHARTLADIYFRRTTLGSYADRSASVIEKVAALAGIYLKWNAAVRSKQIARVQALVAGSISEAENRV